MTMAVLPDLAAYRRFVVAFSGGKDSLASLLVLLEHGIPPDRIELHHHEVDADQARSMDVASRRVRRSGRSDVIMAGARGEGAFGGMRIIAPSRRLTHVLRYALSP